MKISLRWLCDHIAITWNQIDINKLVADFNTKTAEIEHVIHYRIDIKNFTLGAITSISEQIISLKLSEWGTVIELPLRTDAEIGHYYLIKKSGDSFSWVSYADMQSEKEGFLKSFLVTESSVASGEWRTQIETEDYLLEVDNKSITHRPDMWGHRGFAREVAALLDVAMLPEKDFLEPLTIEYKENSYNGSGSLPIALAIKTQACSALAGVLINDLKNQPSVLAIATRLLRVESKHHDFIVDATNYVMFDLGHPMHAFDATKIEGSLLEVRTAEHDEPLEVLDGTELILTDKDSVVADAHRVLSLAGIKGGKDSGISQTTTKVLLEAACFDAGTIRLSSLHHKIRTDASARFEKTLDPEMTTQVLRRYIHLLKEYNISYTGVSSIVRLGKQVEPVSLVIDQKYIELRLGVALPDGFIRKTLEQLDFGVVEEKNKETTVYTITIPTFRATKDVEIKEDIVEEIGRFYGYTSIPMDTPYCGKQPMGLTWFDTVGRLKEYLAQEAHMHEVQNYALFDNDFLGKLQWNCTDGVILKNPLSEQRTTMVTSLIPHLLQNIDANMPNNDSLGFFEWARTWHRNDTAVVEQQVLAGIWYERKNNLDFYDCKEHIKGLFEVLKCPVQWEKLEEKTAWSSLHQVAQLVYEGIIIGKAGKVSKALLHTLGGGDAFVFELDGDFIKSYIPKQSVFKPLPKYQATSLDITMIVPLKVTVAQITDLIKGADPRIFDVVLHDIFVKTEWTNKKSLTMRFYIRDEAKTMDKQEIESVYQSVVALVKPLVTEDVA